MLLDGFAGLLHSIFGMLVDESTYGRRFANANAIAIAERCELGASSNYDYEPLLRWQRIIIRRFSRSRWATVSRNSALKVGSGAEVPWPTGVSLSPVSGMLSYGASGTKNSPSINSSIHSKGELRVHGKADAQGVGSTAVAAAR